MLSMGLSLGSSKRRGAATFSPSSISGHELSLDATRGRFQDTALTVPAVLDTDPVGGWQDFSGNNRHVTQATGAAKPLLKLAIQNGLPVLRFDGIGSCLVKTAPFIYQHIFVVAKYAGATFASYSGLACTITGSGLFLLGVSGDTRFFSDTDQTATYTKDGVTEVGTMWPGPMNAFACIDLVATSAHNQDFQVGLDRALGGFWLGDICQVEVYSAQVVGDDLTNMRTYLKGKWGTP